MKELNKEVYAEVNGGYDACEFAGDVTETFFTAAGALIGGAITMGAVAVVGGAVGSLVGSMAASVVEDDCNAMSS
jgi:hypothetical protein